jgi:hypothetical protein
MSSTPRNPKNPRTNATAYWLELELGKRSITNGVRYVALPIPLNTAALAVFQSRCRPMVSKLPKNPLTARPTSIPLSFSTSASMAWLFGGAER